jgi:hypothetical protein
MSTASTNQPATPPELPLAPVPVAEAIPPAVVAELTALRTELAAAKMRLAWLESTIPVAPMVRKLMPPDSPENQLALQLASEVFPGSETTVEINCDPAEPNWPWYCLNIRWDGPENEVINRQLLWHRRMADAFPQLRDEFRLSICYHESK